MNCTIQELSVLYSAEEHQLLALNTVSLELIPGRITALVGKSGSGKTTLGKAVMGLLPEDARVQGSIRLDQTELVGLPEPEYNALRWSRMAMLFQNGADNLDPLHRIVDQLAEPLIHKQGLAKTEARKQVEQALLLITHDLDLAARVADEVLILYLGQVMEILPARDLFAQPDHPYTLALGRSYPGLDTRRELGGIRGDAFYRVLHRHREHNGGVRPHSHIVGQEAEHEDGHVPPSGCLFQESCTQAVSHRFSVQEIVAEPLRIQKQVQGKEAIDARVREALKDVHLSTEPGFLKRYPHELNMGALQRVCIARALVTGPSLLVADEPTSSLDPSVQAKVLKMMLDLQIEKGLTMHFVTHDLGVARKIGDRTGVMLAGHLVETGPAAHVLEQPGHPYTQSLLEGAGGTMALSPAKEANRTGQGCPFAQRCSRVRSVCWQVFPRPVQRIQGWVACHHPL